MREHRQLSYNNKKLPELLIPAGNLETLKTAVRYGADAVYIGGEAFSLRQKADNFDQTAMQEGVAFAHAHGAKLYVTANIFAHDADLKQAERYFKELGETKPDAVIISDPGLFSMCRRILPDMEIHISTQMNNTNYETFRFWNELGAKRVVTARELSLTEIADIRAHIPDTLEIESFVHGAMCISYSGRCLLSSFMTGRDANRGACTHPCRWKYALEEETRPGEYFPVDEDERGTYIFNSKDLCMIEHLPELIEAGIDSLKVEGRMKTQLYVATAARTYRRALDDLAESKELYLSRMPLYLEEIRKCTYRAFTTGFYFGRPGKEAQIYDNNTYAKDYIFLGEVKEVTPEGLAVIEQKNKFAVGDEIEIMKPDMTDVSVRVEGMFDLMSGEAQDTCPHPKQKLLLKLSTIPEKYDILECKSSPKAG